jgi:hypothetical protein
VGWVTIRFREEQGASLLTTVLRLELGTPPSPSHQLVRGALPSVWIRRDLKMTIRLHLASTVRTSAATSPVRLSVSWSDASLRRETTFYFTSDFFHFMCTAFQLWLHSSPNYTQKARPHFGGLHYPRFHWELYRSNTHFILSWNRDGHCEATAP